MWWINIAIGIHVLSSVIWVGGLFMLYVVVWPSINEIVVVQKKYLEASANVMQRFSPWLMIAIVTLVITGYLMLFLGVYQGNMKLVPLYIHIMQFLGLLMLLIAFYIRFLPWKKLLKALEAGNLEQTEKYLVSIKRLVLYSLMLGVVTILMAASGRYWNHFFGIAS